MTAYRDSCVASNAREVISYPTNVESLFIAGELFYLCPADLRGKYILWRTGESITRADLRSDDHLFKIEYVPALPVIPDLPTLPLVSDNENHSPE